METHSGKTSEIKFLGSIIHETTSLRGRIAILTYQNLTHSVLADRILIFIEHFQTVILFVFTNYTVFTNRNSVSASIINIVYPIVFSASPGSFISYTKETTSTVVLVFFFGLLLFLFKMAVFGAISFAALRNKPPSKNIQLTWQWIFKLQPRVIYYLMAPIWTSIASATFDDLLNLHQVANNLLKVLSILMFVCEFVFSLILQTQFTCTLPTKNFLSSKNNITQILTLLQKFTNHSIRKILTFAPMAAVWIANFITLFLGILKLSLYLKYLPAYDVDCLFYQLYFIVVTLALNIACTLQVIFGDSRIDMNLVVLLWFLLSLLFLKISNNYLKNRLSTMVLENKEKSPETLIHKIIAVKYFWKNGGIAKKGLTDSKWTSLVKATLIGNVQNAFSIIPQEEFITLDIADSKSRSKIFSMYLEELLLKNPKSDFIRLYAAYYFAKNQRLYGKCLRTIHELKQSTIWNIDISISVLFHNIKERIIKESKHKTFIFDISEFAQSTSLFAQAKLEIIKQAELQASLYQEMKENSPLVVRLKNLGGKITKAKRKIERTRKKLLQIIPEYYLEPLLLYAHYYLVLNYSYDKSVEHSRIYTKRSQKYLKTFKADNFCQENFYKKNTGFLIFSGERQTQGKILYCGGNYQEMFERNITGSYIGITVSSITMSDPKVMWNLIMEKQEKSLLNQLQQRFYYHQNGYMTEVQYFMNISPFVQSQGLTYYVIFRPVKTHRDCILINKDGLIECFTKKIGEELGLSLKLSTEERNIEKLSPELQLANEAFNAFAADVNSSQFIAKEGNLTFGKAQEICDSYTNEGQILYLAKVNNSKPGCKIPYRCTINPLKHNIHGAKEIYLEKIIERTTKLTLLEEEAGEREDTVAEILDEKLPEQINSKPYPFRTSPMSSDRHLRTARSGKHKTTIQREATDFQTETGRVLLEQEENESYSNVLSRNESIFSLHSEFMGRNKIKKQKAFEETINAPHGRARTYLLIFLEACTLTSIFGLQLNMNIRIRQGFSDFGINKDIVLTAQSRNFNITNLNSVLSVYYGKAIGLFEVSDLFPGKDLVYLRGNLDQTITDLNHANTYLLEITNNLNDEQRDQLFQKDVRLQDGGGSGERNLSSFLATNQIIESSLKAADLAKTDISQAIPYLRFGIYNIMNDILIKGNSISTNFYTYLKDRKNDFISSLTLTFTAIIIIPVLAFIIGSVVIIIQYKSEWRNFLAFTKINKNAVDTALNSTMRFKNFLQQNTNLEVLLKDERFLKNNTLVDRKNQIHDNIMSLNSKGFAKEYIFLDFIVFIMVLLVSVSFGIYFVSIKKNLNKLGDKADQLYYLDRAAERIILLRSGVLQMIATNDRTFIYNRKASTVLEEQIELLQDVQHQFQDIFSQEENEIVQGILFNDACEYLKNIPSYYSSCRMLGNYQKKSSWINLISNIRDLFDSYMTKFEESDKTDASLKSLESDYVINLMLPLANVAKTLNNLLTESVDTEFEKINSDTNEYNNKMIGIYMIILIITGCLGIWGVILPLQAIENKFKQFLLLFPADMILANFMLKMYLMRISTGSFDSYMQDI